MAQNIIVPGMAQRTDDIILTPEQTELLNSSSPLLFLSGPPRTGKTTVLIRQGKKWLECGHDVHIVSTWPKSRAVAIAIEHQIQEFMSPANSSGRVYQHHFNFNEDGEVETAVTSLESKDSERQLCVIADEAADYRGRFRQFVDELISQAPGVCLWGASNLHEDIPPCLVTRHLTTPLRSPRVIVREIMLAMEFKNERVLPYTATDILDRRDGPEIKMIRHQDGHSGHSGNRSLDCEKCGQEIARILSELNVAVRGDLNDSSSIQYGDVFVLCDDYPNDNQDNMADGQITGLVRSLRASHVTVRVVGNGDEVALRDTALGNREEVTILHWDDAYGLERKVIVVANYEQVMLRRYHVMSRCSSQLVFIENEVYF